MDNHQAINCKIINDNKLGWVIDEDNFENNTLKKIIEDTKRAKKTTCE